ncbi:hypothetical protein ACVCAH_24975 [Micromonospora sp. LZ34]
MTASPARLLLMVPCIAISSGVGPPFTHKESGDEATRRAANRCRPPSHRLLRTLDSDGLLTVGQPTSGGDMRLCTHSAISGRYASAQAQTHMAGHAGEPHLSQAAGAGFVVGTEQAALTAAARAVGPPPPGTSPSQLPLGRGAAGREPIDKQVADIDRRARVCGPSRLDAAVLHRVGGAYCLSAFVRWNS